MLRLSNVPEEKENNFPSQLRVAGLNTGIETSGFCYPHVYIKLLLFKVLNIFATQVIYARI